MRAAGHRLASEAGQGSPSGDAGLTQTVRRSTIRTVRQALRQDWPNMGKRMKSLMRLGLLAVLLLASFFAGFWAGRIVRSERVSTQQQEYGGEGGLFHERGHAAAEPEDDLYKLALLDSLIYGTGSNVPKAPRGVTVPDPARVADGYNLYSSGHGPQAFLMDMSGRALHEWHMDRNTVWPHLAGVDHGKSNRYFERVRLFDNGDVLALYPYTGLVKLDRNSRLLWDHQGWNHHGLDVDEQGRIYVLGRDFDEEGRPAPESREEPPPRRKVSGRWVLDENITVLSADGELLDKISLIDCLENSRFAPLLDPAKYPGRSEPIDLLHPNSLQVLDGRHVDRSPAFKKGNVLTSFRDLSTIAIIDPEEEKVVWALSHGWRGQHDPALLANGRMLLFNNFSRPIGGDPQDQRSQVMEFDPLTQQVTWSYGRAESTGMFSALFGASQRLPNGNTLITESDDGRAIEVTPDGAIVWEFNNPHTSGPNGEFVAVIPKVFRVSSDQAWLER